MNETSALYRLYRPEIPLLDWVRQQARPVIVHKQDLAMLHKAGVPNIATLPRGGPQPGEAWVQL